MMFMNKKDDKFYIEKLISMEKDCWRSNQPGDFIWKAQKMLKSKKINELNTPYVYSLKEEIDLLDCESSNYEKQVREILSRVYKYDKFKKGKSLKTVN